MSALIVDPENDDVPVTDRCRPITELINENAITRQDGWTHAAGGDGKCLTPIVPAELQDAVHDKRGDDRISQIEPPPLIPFVRTFPSTCDTDRVHNEAEIERDNQQ